MARKKVARKKDVAEEDNTLLYPSLLFLKGRIRFVCVLLTYSFIFSYESKGFMFCLSEAIFSILSVFGQFYVSKIRVFYILFYEKNLNLKEMLL